MPKKHKLSWHVERLGKMKLKWERSYLAPKGTQKFTAETVFGHIGIWDEYEQNGTTRRGFCFRLLVGGNRRIVSDNFYPTFEKAKEAAEKLAAKESLKWVNKYFQKVKS